MGISIDLLVNCWPSRKYRETRILSNRGKLTFKVLLRNINFTLTGNGINQIFYSYFKKIFEVYENAFPLTNGIAGRKETAPWLTHKLKQCIKKKAKLYKLYLKGKVNKIQYITFRNQVTSAVRKSKRLYYLKKFFEAGNSSSMVWSCINDIMGKKKTVTLECIEVNGISLTGRYLANHVNNYFVTAAASLISGMVRPLTCTFLSPPVLASCFLYPATWFEVRLIIRRLKNKGNKILDISPLVLKDNDSIFSYHFADLYNLSIGEEQYPNTLKRARVTPVHKSGSTTNLDNYRPISVLPTLSKIFEKLTLNRLESFITAQSILTPCQFGFRRGKSTTHAILTLLAYIQAAFHKKLYCVCFFFRLKESF